MKNREAQGFTLIELLIVIAIIGILAAVLIPNLLGARRAAMIRAEESYAQNVYKAAAAYISENTNATALPSGADVCTGATYDVGSYGAGSKPSTIGTTCTVTFTTGTQTVRVDYTSTIDGRTGTYTIGN